MRKPVLTLEPRLARYHVRELGCSEALLYEPGLHIVVTPLRLRPGWGGTVMPVLAMTFEGSESTIVSVPPNLVDQVKDVLRGYPAGRPLRPDDLESLRPLAERYWPYSYILNGDALYCARGMLRPFPGAAEHLSRRDPAGTFLRFQFDGEIFVIRGRFGEIASWAAIKLKSDDVWEIAVTTEPAYRGRGYAKRVVSAATEYILSQGRIALYIHDRANIPSARVCRALGYQKHASIFFAEYR